MSAWDYRQAFEDEREAVYGGPAPWEPNVTPEAMRELLARITRSEVRNVPSDAVE